jgi:hypothetical protein
MISCYTKHRPSASLLFSTNLSTLAYSVPAVATLVQTSWPRPQRNPPLGTA